MASDGCLGRLLVEEGTSPLRQSGDLPPFFPPPRSYIGRRHHPSGAQYWRAAKRLGSSNYCLPQPPNKYLFSKTAQLQRWHLLFFSCFWSAISSVLDNMLKTVFLGACARSRGDKLGEGGEDRRRECSGGRECSRGKDSGCGPAAGHY